MTRWQDATSSRYQPGEYLALGQALDQLHLAAYPQSGRALGIIGRHSNASDGIDADPRRRRFRTALNDVLKDLALMRQRIENMFPKEDKPAAVQAYEQLQRDRAWHCPNCNRRGRPQAKYCDQCGTAKP